MKLLKLIEPQLFEGGYARFELNEKESKEEMQIMKKVQDATFKTLWTKEKSALHNLDYKRDIKLEDGRVLKKAWCMNLELNDDNTTTGDFNFAEIEEAK